MGGALQRVDVIFVSIAAGKDTQDIDEGILLKCWPFLAVSCRNL